MDLCIIIHIFSCIAGLPRKTRHYPTELLVSALGTVGVSLLVALMCFWGCFLYHKFWKKSKPCSSFDPIENIIGTLFSLGKTYGI